MPNILCGAIKSGGDPCINMTSMVIAVGYRRALSNVFTRDGIGVANSRQINVAAGGVINLKILENQHAVIQLSASGCAVNGNAIVQHYGVCKRHNTHRQHRSERNEQSANLLCNL